MNLRWLLGNFADPEFRLTRRQQREVTWLAHKKYLPARRLTLWTLGLIAFGYLALAFAFDPLAGLFFRLGRPWPHLISAALIVVAVSAFAAWMYRFLYVGPVRRAMRDLGFDICVNCGYRLEGLNDSIERCPECGGSRQSSPSSAEPKS